MFIRKSVSRLSNQYESSIDFGSVANKHTPGDIEDNYDAVPLNYGATPILVSTGSSPSPKPPHSKMMIKQQTLPAAEHPITNKNKLKVGKLRLDESEMSDGDILKKIWDFKWHLPILHITLRGRSYSLYSVVYSHM